MGVNEAALRWMLERPPLHGTFLNTKLSSLSLRDYDDEDGWRGPRVLYGWIQGRGLEALARHAAFFELERPDLAAALDAAGRRLYRALAELYARHGAAYFAYDGRLEPVYPAADGRILPQSPAGKLRTYTDAFVLKGLVAASARFEPDATDGHVRDLVDVANAIEENRFQMDERRPLDPDTVTRQPDDYGPRMILLGAAALLRDLGREAEAGFGSRLVEHVLDRHVQDGRGQLPAGTTLDVPGQDRCNAGHAIEFVGFTLELLGTVADPALVARLERVLLASFRLAFSPPGLRLLVSASTGEPLSPYRPWWSLPETVRAAALVHERTGSPASLDVWRTAHDAFFASYWRPELPIAYQTLDDRGPVDYVPATPDLDPGYHTGLSFLGAIGAIDRMAGGPAGVKA